MSSECSEISSECSEMSSKRHCASQKTKGRARSISLWTIWTSYLDSRVPFQMLLAVSARMPSPTGLTMPLLAVVGHHGRINRRKDRRPCTQAGSPRMFRAFKSRKRQSIQHASQPHTRQMVTEPPHRQSSLHGVMIRHRWPGPMLAVSSVQIIVNSSHGFPLQRWGYVHVRGSPPVRHAMRHVVSRLSYRATIG